MVTATTIKKGYKQTELGVIPEDWDVFDITQLIDRANGIKIGPFGSQLKKELLTNSGYKVYGQENVYERDMEIGKRYISKEHFKMLNSCELIEGDFIISMMGTIGKCMIVPELKESGIMDSHLIRLRLDRKKLDAELLFHFFSSSILINQVKKLSVGGIMDGLSSKIIKSIQVPLPTTKAEQTAIATIFSDTDALIERLEKLIAKKIAIKQGTMQQLLTGKKRLQGFSGEWKMKTLGEIATIVGGGTPSTYSPNYWNGTINWFTPTEIGLNKYTYSSLRKITKEGLKNCSARILPTGTVLLTTRAGIGDMSILMNEGCTNQGFQSLIANNDTSYEFLYYLVSTLKNILIKNASGSTFLEISPNKIKQIEVKIPSIKEQTAIVVILSDMDAEIENLEQKRDKYTMLKQGMMQQLLTGRIRIHATN